jgi:anti-anti-sigma regulatory factor
MGPELNPMQLTTLDIPHEYVLALSGHIGPAQMPELRARLVDAVTRTEGDVLIDTRQVTAFDDTALVALTAARKRAKFLRHQILILDSADGHVARSLRRAGMHIRMPAFPDAATAAQHLAADRDARARLTLNRARPRAPEPVRGEPGRSTTAAIPPDRAAVPRAS